MTEQDYDHPVDLGDVRLTYGKLARHIPAGAEVLDIGCSVGAFGLALQHEMGCRVLGLEVDPEAVSRARARGLEVIETDAQEVALETVLAGRHFDFVVLADVLEHLVTPGRLLSQIPSLLKPQGKLLVSLPNVTHVDVQLMLAQDDWRYRSSGLLDRTHLRFFSLARFSELAFACGFDLLSNESVVVPCLGTELLDFGHELTLTPAQLRAIKGAAEESNPHANTYQHVLVLAPAPPRLGRVQLEESAPLTPTSGRDVIPDGLPAVDVILLASPSRFDLTKLQLQALKSQAYPMVSLTVVIQSGDESDVAACESLLKEVLPPGYASRIVTAPPSRSAALKRGLEVTNHEFLCFWADDESPSSSFITDLAPPLQRTPWASAVVGRCRIARGLPEAHEWRNLEEVGVVGLKGGRLELVGKDVVTLGCALLRRSSLIETRPLLAEGFDSYPEWTLLAGLAAQRELETIPSVVVTTWVHPRRVIPVPSEATEEHERVLRVAANQNGGLTVRTRRADVMKLVAERDGIAAQLDEAKSALASALESERSQAAAARLELDRVLASRSWKVTSPLRWITHSKLPR